MKPSKKDKTEADILRSVADQFDQILDTDMEEVDATLRASGYDPDAVGKRMQAAAQQALAESPLNWRTQQAEIAQRRAALESVVLTVRATRDQLLQMVASLAEEVQRRHGAQPVAHFRNLEEVADEDLIDIVDQLRFMLDES